MGVAILRREVQMTEAKTIDGFLWSDRERWSVWVWKIESFCLHIFNQSSSQTECLPLYPS